MPASSLGTDSLARALATATAQARVERDVPLAPFTTFGIGGPADLLARPQTSEELAEAVTWARGSGLPWFVLGTGANILIGDGGFRGIVIRNEATHARIDGTRLVAETGAIFAELIEQAAAAGLSGIEHYTGIPSTLGGALWQNLHFLSPDRSRTMFIEEVVESARVLLDTGELATVDREWFAFGYDDSVLHHHRHIVLDATLALEPADREQVDAVRAANQAWRDEKHPAGAVSASAGSIFQKLEGIGAGRLIDAAGLKGHAIGGAVVSPHHANFIMNAGGATAADVRALIAHVQDEVERTSGHRLQPEISFVGEF